jgi:hypothetical protein
MLMKFLSQQQTPDKYFGWNSGWRSFLDGNLQRYHHSVPLVHFFQTSLKPIGAVRK